MFKIPLRWWRNFVAIFHWCHANIHVYQNALEDHDSSCCIQIMISHRFPNALIKISGQSVRKTHLKCSPNIALISELLLLLNVSVASQTRWSTILSSFNRWMKVFSTRHCSHSYYFRVVSQITESHRLTLNVLAASCIKIIALVNTLIKPTKNCELPMVRRDRRKDTLSFEVLLPKKWLILFGNPLFIQLLGKIPKNSTSSRLN